MQKWKLSNGATALRRLAGRGAGSRASQGPGPGQAGLPGPGWAVGPSGGCGAGPRAGRATSPWEGSASAGSVAWQTQGCAEKGPLGYVGLVRASKAWEASQAITHRRLKGLCPFLPCSFIFPLRTSFPECCPQIYFQPGLWLLQFVLCTTKQKKEMLFSYCSVSLLTSTPSESQSIF